MAEADGHVFASPIIDVLAIRFLLDHASRQGYLSPEFRDVLYMRLLRSRDSSSDQTSGDLSTPSIMCNYADLCRLQTVGCIPSSTSVTSSSRCAGSLLKKFCMVAPYIHWMQASTRCTYGCVSLQMPSTLRRLLHWTDGLLLIIV